VSWLSMPREGQMRAPQSQQLLVGASPSGLVVGTYTTQALITSAQNATTVELDVTFSVEASQSVSNGQTLPSSSAPTQPQPTATPKPTLYPPTPTPVPPTPMPKPTPTPVPIPTPTPQTTPPPVTPTP